MQKQKVVFIISHLEKARSFEWIADELADENIEQVYIFLNPSDSSLASNLNKKGKTVYQVPYKGKLDLVSAFIKCYRLLKAEKPSVVHTHLFEASLIGLMVARLVGVRKRIYTRHHSTLHHQYFPQAVKYDKLINYLATDIVVISQNVRQVLIDERVDERKLHYIPHGFRFEAFAGVNEQRKQQVRTTHGIPLEASPVIGVIARFTHWKGIQYIIPAFDKLSKEFKNAHLVMANAVGDYHKELTDQLKQLPVGSYTLIIFEPDLAALYEIFDVYVHVPIDPHSEAFGQTYIEALATGRPSIFTLSGIANEFVKDQENALVVPFCDSESIHKALKKTLTDGYDKSWIEKGKQDVKIRFQLSRMIDRLEKLYMS